MQKVAKNHGRPVAQTTWRGRSRHNDAPSVKARGVRLFRDVELGSLWRREPLPTAGELAGDRVLDRAHEGVQAVVARVRSDQRDDEPNREQLRQDARLPGQE